MHRVSTGQVSLAQRERQAVGAFVSDNGERLTLTCGGGGQSSPRKFF